MEKNFRVMYGYVGVFDSYFLAHFATEAEAREFIKSGNAFNGFVFRKFEFEYEPLKFRLLEMGEMNATNQ